jgi:quercetin dioxygenase-like cupin family protein
MTISEADNHVSAAGAGTGSDRSRYATFTGEPVCSLEETAPVTTFPDVARALFAADPTAREALRAGARTTVLFRHTDPDGYSLMRVDVAPGYMLPSHTHDVDCLYYLVRGEVHAGARTFTAGQGFYVPADVRYGYTAGPDGASVLEFRHATSFRTDVRENSQARWTSMVDNARAHDFWPDFGPMP